MFFMPKADIWCFICFAEGFVVDEIFIVGILARAVTSVLCEKRLIYIIILYVIDLFCNAILMEFHAIRQQGLDNNPRTARISAL